VLVSSNCFADSAVSFTASFCRVRLVNCADQLITFSCKIQNLCYMLLFVLFSVQFNNDTRCLVHIKHLVSISSSDNFQCISVHAYILYCYSI